MWYVMYNQPIRKINETLEDNRWHTSCIVVKLGLWSFLHSFVPIWITSYEFKVDIYYDLIEVPNVSMNWMKYFY